MPKQTLSVLEDIFAIHSLSEDSSIPAVVLSSDFYFIGKTNDELSLVVKESLDIEAIETDKDWRVLEVLGPLNLSMIGIMAQISQCLAQAEVSIFVVSTFETDYILVKNLQLETAVSALASAGYEFV
ncbi:ACT domain-containing protein [Glaciecola sp. KUL10]|uniref:ACT domain-containing protein n=1 Tax=Glaciecola sp. (strain KUL10) TaxID=2161813 RepID=UPI000D781EF3|nr:ACT domain-containing protein [Glaciecola sp. KUL10]GBL03115.1 amino acid-binding ACT domain-containing protein [Glaciecola sp. KUL10]